jgi:hypothetical protein
MCVRMLVIRGSFEDSVIRHKGDFDYFKYVLVKMPWNMEYQLLSPKKN